MAVMAAACYLNCERHFLGASCPFFSVYKADLTIWAMIDVDNRVFTSAKNRCLGFPKIEMAMNPHFGSNFPVIGGKVFAKTKISQRNAPIRFLFGKTLMKPNEERR